MFEKHLYRQAALAFPGMFAVPVCMSYEPDVLFLPTVLCCNGHVSVSNKFSVKAT